MANERTTAFKVGFLKKVAELGLTPDEFVKLALDPTDLLLSGGSGLMHGATGALALGGKTLGAAALGAPIVAGGIAGAADAALNAPTGEDIDSLRNAEMVGLLNRLTAEIRTRRARGQA